MTLVRERSTMLAKVFSTLIVAKRRSLFQLFPESFARRWNLWELRKYKHQMWVTVVLWLAYQIADWATNFSLNVLSHGQDDCKTNSLDPNYITMTFWAPLFLVQLCSPDTITAYSLEDNELWFRHLFSLVSSFAVAIYIINRSWTGSLVDYLAIPMLVAGMIKFAERNWVQYMASSDQFRDSMLPPPDPGPNYAKFMDAYSAKESEGFKINRGPLIETPTEEDPFQSTTAKINNIPDEDILDQAYSSFDTFKKLFADLILSFQDYKNSRSFFHKHSCKVAFQLIEVELGFIYDVLYTKAIVIYSRSGLALFLRLISLSLVACVFCAFLIIRRHNFRETNVIITCALLGGANILEFYEVILFFSSDWTMLWLGRHKNLLVDCINKTIYFLRCWHLVPANKRWSDHMAEYNLLFFCLKEKSATPGQIWKFIHEKLKRFRYKSKAVPSELKELIFKLLTEKSMSAKNIKECKQLCAFRGSPVLEIMDCLDQLGWSVEVEFDQSILIWHIATDICYHLNTNSSSDENSQRKISELRKISKMLSNYMLYLLVMCPFMLPNGIGQIRFQDTCAEAIDFLQEYNSITEVYEACTELLQVNTKVMPSEVKGDRSKSVLFDACRLAKTLQNLETERQWKVVSHVWVEMMSYASTHCRWQYHAKQLTKGGELLIHVSLLMAHLGISEQFQISEVMNSENLVKIEEELETKCFSNMEIDTTKTLAQINAHFSSKPALSASELGFAVRDHENGVRVSSEGLNGDNVCDVEVSNKTLIVKVEKDFGEHERQDDEKGLGDGDSSELIRDGSDKNEEFDQNGSLESANESWRDCGDEDNDKGGRVP
ncbi:unnamed protein product [Camellia sinensis]